MASKLTSSLLRPPADRARRCSSFSSSRLRHLSSLAAGLVLLFASTVALAAVLPPQGCLPDKCASLVGPPPVKGDTRVGYWLGNWNNYYKPPKDFYNKPWGPYLNYEVYTELGHVIKALPADSIGECCSLCAQTDGCWLYQWFEKKRIPAKKIQIPGFERGKQCYLLKGGDEKKDGNAVFGTPYSGDKVIQNVNKEDYEPSWLGGLCNGNASVVDDPHFVGAMGTHFDFNGQLDKSFCLATDQRLQVNILLRGYEDQRTQGATKQPNGKALRSWIKEIGIIWYAKADGKRHTVHLIARKGKQQARGSGFLSQLLVDGLDMAVPNKKRDTLAPLLDLSLTLVNIEKKGQFDVDHYTLKIKDLAEIDFKMRVAHPALQLPDDAEAHFNVHFTKLAATPAVHGVLGQTYRADEKQMTKALKYTQLNALLHGPIVADGESGEGFLDGKVEDYVTSNVLATDCKFSPFQAA